MSTHVVSSLFGQLSVTEPVGFGSLQVFGLRAEVPSALEYRTLDEALADHELEITEVSESGSVPTLRLSNRSNKRLFLLAGEQLIGAKQNRVLNTSMLVEAASEIPIPVSCVEQGRWGYRSRAFSSKGTSSHSKLRSVLSESVTMSFASSGTPTSDQGAVWREVSRKLGAMASHSDSAALEQVYDDRRASLDEVLAALPAPEGCCGAVFVIGGKVVGLDLFDQSETLKKLWPKVARGYAVDALEAGDTEVTASDLDNVKGWLEAASHLEAAAYPSPGLGQDVRLRGERQSGSGLVVEERPVHVQVFSGSTA